MPEELVSLLADIFDVEPPSLTPDTTLEDLGADEYDREEISFNLEEMYGFEPDGKRLKKVKTLRELQDYIRENTK